jgi:hypothetical protein
MKKIMMSFLFAHGMAHASVNLQTGSWFWKINLHELEMTYNSRSLHQGWWGQGWCSDMDAKLRQVSKSRVEFLHCSQKESALIKKTDDGYDVNTPQGNFRFNERFQLQEVSSPAVSLHLYWEGSALFQLEINGRL